MGTDTDVRVSIRDILALRSEIAELKEIILGGQTKVNEVKHAPAETEEPETTPSPTVRLCGAPIGSSTANGVHKTCQQPVKYDEDGKLARESGKPPIHCGKHRKNKPPRKDKGTARLHKSEEGVPRPVTPQTDDPIPRRPRSPPSTYIGSPSTQLNGAEVKAKAKADAAKAKAPEEAMPIEPVPDSELPRFPLPHELLPHELPHCMRSFTMIEAGGSPLPIGVFEKVRKAEEDQVAFWTACYDGDEHLVHRLIGKVDVNKGFKDGNSGVDDVRALIKEGKVDLSKAGHDGWTPLHAAIRKGRSGVVRVLLGSEMVKDGDLHHALHQAAHMGHVDIARALLDARADTTKTMKSNDTYNGMTAREIAAKRGHERIVRMIDETEEARKAEIQARQAKFWDACSDGNLPLVRSLIKKVDVNHEDNRHSFTYKWGKTPLVAAVISSHHPRGVMTDIVHTLINAGADVNMVCHTSDCTTGMTPLQAASYYSRNVDIVRALIDAGADCTKRVNELFNGHCLSKGDCNKRCKLSGLTARDIALSSWSFVWGTDNLPIARVLDEAEKADKIKESVVLQRKLDKSEKEKKRLQREEMDAADGLTRLDPGPKKVKKSECEKLNDNLSKNEEVTGPRREDSKITWK